jgi:predicted mannosyl-3-phosphoglycerate phosphatase (HAD superfamily)
MLIFSDVDGTLLDEDGRCPLPSGLFQRVASAHQVVLTSSRHTGELREVQEQLGISGPVIAEDGSVVTGPNDSITLLGQGRAELHRRVSLALGEAQATDLIRMEPPAQGVRLASILLPATVAQDSLVARLAAQGLSLTTGGRWATVTSGSNKGRAAVHVATTLGVESWAAVGDSANDEPLLRSAHRAFVIRHPDGHHPRLRGIEGATLLQGFGPLGWAQMIEQLEQREP